MSHVLNIASAIGNRHYKVLGIGLIIILSLTPPLVGYGGWDFLYAYRADTLNQTFGNLTWNPWPTYWFISLFAVLPPKIGYLLWNFLNSLCFIIAIWYWSKPNDATAYLKFGLTLPAFWIFFGGQIEGFIALGIVLSLMPNPLLAGIGLALLTMKPQVGLFPILFVLFHRLYQKEPNWPILIVPGLIYLASFFVWGWWIDDWLESIRQQSLLNQNATNISLWPYSLLLLPFLWWGRSSIKIWLIIQSLVLPYFAVYSLAVLFTLEAPVWAAVTLWCIYISANYITYPIIPGFVVPLGMLILSVWAQKQNFNLQSNWLK